MSREKIVDIVNQLLMKNIQYELENSVKWNEVDKMKEIGLDSLSYVKCIVEIEENFHIEFNDDIFDPQKIITLRDIINRIELKLYEK